MSLSIVEPVLFPSTVQAIPDPNLEGKNVAIVVSGSIGTVTGQDTIPLPLTSRSPEQEALDLAAAQPADITFYNAGPNNTLVPVSPTDPSFNPVELTINLQKGISLENTGVVDATAGQNIYLDSGQDLANQGALLPITLDQVTAQGGVSSGHPDGVVRILGLDGVVNGQPGRGHQHRRAAISSWKGAIPAESVRACSRSSSTWPPRHCWKKPTPSSACISRK